MSSFYFQSKPAACLRLFGEDAESFVQGQCSQDILGEPTLTKYSLWLDHQGKILADSFILKISAEEFLIVSYYTSGTFLKDRLEKFIVADDVEIEDLTSDFYFESFYGKGAIGKVENRIGKKISEDKFIETEGAYYFRGLRGAEISVECLTKELKGKPSGIEELEIEDMEQFRIQAGIPRVGVDLTSEDVPLYAALDNALSLAKGCFVGQEVVARMARLGRVNKRLLVGTSNLVVKNNDELVQDGKKIGQVRSVAMVGDSYLFFALVHVSKLDVKHSVLIRDNKICLKKYDEI